MSDDTVEQSFTLSSSVDARCTLSVTCRQAIKIHMGDKGTRGDMTNYTTEVEASSTCTEAAPGSISEADLNDKVLRNVTFLMREKLEENAILMESFRGTGKK